MGSQVWEETALEEHAVLFSDVLYAYRHILICLLFPLIKEGRGATPPLPSPLPPSLLPLPLLREGNGTQAPAPNPARPAGSRGPNNAFTHLHKPMISMFDALVGGGGVRGATHALVCLGGSGGGYACLGGNTCMPCLILPPPLPNPRAFPTSRPPARPRPLVPPPSPHARPPTP